MEPEFLCYRGQIVTKHYFFFFPLTKQNRFKASFHPPKNNPNRMKTYQSLNIHHLLRQCVLCAAISSNIHSAISTASAYSYLLHRPVHPPFTRCHSILTSLIGLQMNFGWLAEIRVCIRTEWAIWIRWHNPCIKTQQLIYGIFRKNLIARTSRPVVSPIWLWETPCTTGAPGHVVQSRFCTEILLRKGNSAHIYYETAAWEQTLRNELCCLGIRIWITTACT